MRSDAEPAGPGIREYGPSIRCGDCLMHPAQVRALRLSEMGEHYRQYRMPDTEAEASLGRSLSRYGHASSLVVCLHEDRPEVFNGFKRLAAVRPDAGAFHCIDRQFGGRSTLHLRRRIGEDLRKPRHGQP